jgi:hypothetical protein
MYKFNKAEVLENGTIQLREVEVLELADGSTVDGGFNRRVFTPDMDISTITCDRCKAIAQNEWTADVVAAYNVLVAEATVGE